MPEVLRIPVAEAVHTLAPPRAVLDAPTAALVDQAVAAARAEAYREGEAAGRAAATASIEQAVARVVEVVAALHAEVVGQRDTAATVDLQLAAALATEVLDATPPAAALEVLDRVRQAAAILDDDPLEIRLHPETHAVLDGSCEGGRLRLVADPTLAPGDARVVGAWGGAELTRVALLEAAVALQTEGGA